MSFLLIDVGNSNLKWTMASKSGELSQVHSIPIDSDLDSAWRDCAQPQGILVSSVSSEQYKKTLVNVCTKLWGLSPEFLDSPVAGFGITNAYKEPASLGSDRWAAMVAAFHAVGSAVLVVDAGTALTIDAIDAQGQHLGGLIAPGLALSRKVLVSATQMDLDEFNPYQATSDFFGCTTEQCITSGTCHAASNLIDQAFAQLSTVNTSKKPVCYLTGGDASRLKDKLQCPYHYQPDLVLKGLALIATAS